MATWNARDYANDESLSTVTMIGNLVLPVQATVEQVDPPFEQEEGAERVLIWVEWPTPDNDIIKASFEVPVNTTIVE